MLLLIGIVIGLVLGLTGAGGSVFAVPLLMIIAGLDVHQAIGLSLLAVAASAIFGSIRNGRQQTVLWLPAIMLSISVLFAVQFTRSKRAGSRPSSMSILAAVKPRS